MEAPTREDPPVVQGNKLAAAPVLPANTVEKSERHKIESIFIEQSVLSVGEVHATMDRFVPTIGLLVGERCGGGGGGSGGGGGGDVAFIKSIHRLIRDSECLLERQRIIPSGDSMTLNGPIRGEREAILGYYYVAMEDSRFSVDHLTIQKMLNAVGCLVPVVLRLRRILTGTVEGEIEAGVRFDFYLAHRGLELISIPYRIIDSAFIYPRSLDEQTVAHKEASEQRRRVSTIKNNIDLKYDTALCGLLQAAGDRTENLLWNLQNRLAMEKAHLRELIRRRVEEVGRLWISRPSSDSFENESTEGGGIEHKVSLLIQQMITKELPYALTDSTKKLPISTLSHERPTIAMKTARGASGGNNGSNTINIPKKRTKVTNGTKGIMAKIPPRPILPATMPPNGMRSRSPSSDGESPIKVDPSDG